MKKIFVGIVLVLLMSGLAHAANVMLAWDTITDANVTEVRIYQTTDPTRAKPWTLVATAKMPTNTVTVAVPNSGHYYWYATAANATLESVPSNVVDAVIPIDAPKLRVTITVTTP